MNLSGKKKTKEVLVIIPAYNEEKHLSAVINEIQQSSPEADIAVIDDGSMDNSALLAKSKGVQVLSHPYNMGYGVALQTGYKYALGNEYEYLVQIDGDGQHNPSDIAIFLKALQEDNIDIVIGSRFLYIKNQIPFCRRIMIKLFAFIASLLTHRKITDPLSGYQAMNRKCLKFLTNDFYPEDYPDTDIIMTLHNTGFTIREIGIEVTSNVDRKSMHSGLKPFYYVYKVFLSVFLTLLRSDHKCR